MLKCNYQKDWHDTLTKDTHKHLNKTKTTADFKKHIMQTMSKWFLLPDTWDYLNLQEIHGQQYKYGWIHIFGGLIPAYWTTTQAEFEEGHKYHLEEGGTAWA